METTNFQYYSKVLKKPFDTLDQLMEAENAYNKKIEEEKKKKEEEETKLKIYKEEAEKARKEIDELMKKRDEIDKQISEKSIAYGKKYSPLLYSFFGSWNF